MPLVFYSHQPSQTSNPMNWKLQAITPELNGEEITLHHSSVVGRQQDVDMVIQAADVSRRHAQLELREGALWVVDLASANGTYVNDLRIDAETQLKDQDIVQFAGFKFKVFAPVVVEKNAVEATVLEEGISSRDKRDSSVQLGDDGLPQYLAVPKPAPIPADVTLQAQAEPKVVPPHVTSALDGTINQQRNAKLGLWALFVLLVIAFAIGFYVA